MNMAFKTKELDMTEERPGRRRVTEGMFALITPAVCSYLIVISGSSNINIVKLDIPGRLFNVNPLDLFGFIYLIPFEFVCAVAGSWVRLMWEPTIHLFETGQHPKYMRSAIYSVIFAIVFSLVSYFLIRKTALSIVRDETLTSQSMVFLCYFGAAWATMTGVFDFSEMAVAIRASIRR
jgi:hypothetical protein